MTTTRRPVHGPVEIGRLLVGPSVWVAHFLAIYAFTALACARNVVWEAFGVSVVVWFIGAASLLAAAVLSVTMWLAGRDCRHYASPPRLAGFMHWLTIAIAGLALLAVVWEALAVLFVPICG